jgi:2-polyprenyl-6-hydroxyphenyl methylase/3-demethylubiquinone-9 3-methyltransferase
MSEKTTREYFDTLAGEWGECYRRSRLFRQRYRVFESVLEHIGQTGATALDYGCGSGMLTELLCRYFTDVVATDLSDEMLTQTRKRYARVENVHVLEMTSLNSQQFDLILCSSVIEYVNDPVDFLVSLSRRLQPGGVLLITFAHRHGPIQWFNRQFLSHFQRGSFTQYQRHTFTTGSVQELMNEAELTVEMLSTPIGLPLLSRIGLGELLFVVARR